jgi:UPF0716 protein FxsA
VLAVLIALFVAVPIAELYVIIQVSHVIGVLDTIGLLLLVSIVGAWLVKREGIGVLRRAQARVNAGQVPGRELIDGILVLLAGALMLAPGFLTDCLGILLLLPPVRMAVRALVLRALEKRVIEL